MTGDVTVNQMAKSKDDTSPLMRQHAEMKKKFPDAVLLFRVGDFYETFGEDARTTSRILGLTLTRKMAGGGEYTDLAGVPYHALEQYLPRLVRAGLRVAICEQLEDPKTAKGLVKRGITELVTPGVAYNDMVLEVKKNNFLCGLHLTDKIHGISFLDVSTGEFFLAQGDMPYIEKLLSSFHPSEVVLQRSRQRWFTEHVAEKYYCNTFDDWVFAPDFAREQLQTQFGTTSLKGFGVEDMEMGIIAAGAVLYYLHDTQHDRTANITSLSRLERERYVWLDRFTVRNLELVAPMAEGGKSLLDVVDRTLTPMGSRTMRRWLLMPLKERAPIEERLSTVDHMLRDGTFREKLQEKIKTVGDLERLVTKAAVGRIGPREMLQLRRSLEAVADIRQICSQSGHPGLMQAASQLDPCTSLAERIAKEITPDPPARAEKGGMIADGVDDELDRLRNMAGSGKEYLVSLQKRESEATGISSLKVGFNNVYGYYFEVTHTHRDKVPPEWTRKQTLTGAERYITPELKEYEDRILGAEDRILAIEQRIYEQLVNAVASYIQPIQADAHQVARLDCLQSFAETALTGNYCRPEITDDNRLQILEGRHPVIETLMPPGEQYISNDINLDPESQQIVIITGPNMSGKSALLRQTALIVLLAQVGCYCPARQATIGLVDKIFTRVGASDNLSSGESTFMVEMNETASILNNISPRSLVLLDEIGRGTSTYDGISIAWAITEYLHNNRRSHPKVMFATHYHELIEMEAQYERIKNYHVSVKEVDGRIIFLRKLVPGGSEHSFGIHVARLAGMPPQVVNRADALLQILEAKNADSTKDDKKSKKASSSKAKKGSAEGYQLSFIQLDDPTLLDIKSRLLNIDIDTLTPIEALLKLNEIKKIIDEK